MEVSGPLHALLLYPPRKSPWYRLDRRLGGPQSQSGHSSEEKNSHPCQDLNLLIIQPADQWYTTEISWIMKTFYFNTNM
jgi:hypothetical protein